MTKRKKPSEGESGLSRRDFFKSGAAGTLTTGVITSGLAQAQGSRAGLKGPGRTAVTLNVNGEQRRLQVEPRVTLLDALRDRLDTTGAKKVCDRGTCGACTVKIDGDIVYACSVLAVEADGAKIETIEGLGSPENMHAVQAAFVENDAQQCGFCTPGFVMACTDFLERNPNPTMAQVEKGLGGNLCRCGTYAGIRKAVMQAAGKGVSDA